MISFISNAGPAYPKVKYTITFNEQEKQQDFVPYIDTGFPGDSYDKVWSETLTLNWHD